MSIYGLILSVKGKIIIIIGLPNEQVINSLISKYQPHHFSYKCNLDFFKIWITRITVECSIFYFFLIQCHLKERLEDCRFCIFTFYSLFLTSFRITALENRRNLIMQNKQVLNDFYKRLRRGLATDIVGTLYSACMLP